MSSHEHEHKQAPAWGCQVNIPCFIYLPFFLFLFYWRNGSIQAFMTLRSSLPSLKLKTSFTETQIFFFSARILLWCFVFPSFILTYKWTSSLLVVGTEHRCFVLFLFLCLRLSHCAALLALNSRLSCLAFLGYRCVSLCLANVFFMNKNYYLFQVTSFKFKHKHLSHSPLSTAYNDFYMVLSPWG